MDPKDAYVGGSIQTIVNRDMSGNSAKVFVLSFCSPLCNFVHGARSLNTLYFSIMKELSNSKISV